MTIRTREDALIAASRAGDEVAFAELTEPYRRRLHVHCYRMLASFDDAEDAVQETLLRAWKARGTFDGRSQFRTWMYRIATNVCLDLLERSKRRILVADAPPRDPDRGFTPEERPDLGAPPADLPWIQPYPDELLEQVASSDAGPDAAVVSRETIELAYLAAIQYLPPRQRAALVLRDALGWSAEEAASLLETSVASLNSALQRARATLRSRMPARRADWLAAARSTEAERSVLRRFMDVHERADVAGFAALLREDARQTMPPHAFWFDGRDALVKIFAGYILPTSPSYPGHLRLIATEANRQPAYAAYLRRPGDDTYRLLGLGALVIEDGLITANTSFGTQLIERFGLPATL